MAADIVFGSADSPQRALTVASCLDRIFRRPRGAALCRPRRVAALDDGLLDDLGLRPVGGIADSRRLLRDL